MVLILSSWGKAGPGEEEEVPKLHFAEKISVVTGNTECCVLMCIITNLLR